MKLLVLDERQEEILNQAIASLEDSNMYEDAMIPLIDDMCDQIASNVVTAEDIEKILDSGVDIKV